MSSEHTAPPADGATVRVTVTLVANVSTNTVAEMNLPANGATVTVADGTVRVGDITVTVGGTTVTVGDTAVAVGDTAVAVGDTTVAVGGTTVPANVSTVTVGDRTFSVDDDTTAGTTLIGELKNYIDGEPNDNHDVIARLCDRSRKDKFDRLMDVRGREGRTAIHTAAAMGNIEDLRRLRKDLLAESQWYELLKVRTNIAAKTALHLAIASGDQATIYYILYISVGNSVVRREILQRTDITGNTPLQDAAAQGHDAFAAIFQNNGDVNTWFGVFKIQNDDGNTAIHMVARDGNLDELRAMLRLMPRKSRRILLNLKNNAGLTASQYATDPAIQRLLEEMYDT